MAVTCECPRCGRTRRLTNDEKSCVQCCKISDKEVKLTKINNIVISCSLFLFFIILLIPFIVRGQ